MIKYLCTRLASLVFCILLPAFSYGAYTLTPVKVTINKGEKVTELTLKNENPEVKNFQLKVFRLEKEDGQEILKETKDLTATPMMFRIKPGKTQLIRIAIKNPMYRAGERGYMVSVRELPHKIKGEGTRVHMATEFRVPISIEHHGAASEAVSAEGV